MSGEASLVLAKSRVPTRTKHTREGVVSPTTRAPRIACVRRFCVAHLPLSVERVPLGEDGAGAGSATRVRHMYSRRRAIKHHETRVPAA